MPDKITPGEIFMPSARVWNGMVDASEAYRKRNELGSGVDPRFLPIPTDCIKVLNDSGANRVRGDVLELVGLQTSAVEPTHLWLTGDEPTERGKPFCVLRQATPSGTIDVGQVSGVCHARIDVLVAAHTHARLKRGSSQLESWWAGPVRILYKPSGTGIKDCVALLGECSGGGYPAFLEYGDTITAASGDTPGSGTVTLKQRSSSSGDLITLGTALVYNNTAQTPTASESAIQVKVDYITADLWWDVDDCS